MTWIWAVVVGLAGALGFHITYSAIRSQWPTTYLALSQTFALKVIDSGWRLIAFRAAPTFIISSLVAATALRLGANVALALTIAVGVHLSSTNLRSLTSSFRQGTRESGVNYAGYHLGATFLVLLSSVAAALVLPYWIAVIPTPAEIVANLWLAGFVAIVGAYVIGATGLRAKDHPRFNTSYFVERVRRDVGLDLLDYLHGRALQDGTDPVLLKAIMVAEVLQRPKWFRRLEYAKGVLIRRGSYGVMQVSSSRPLSDIESINLASTALKGVWGARMESLSFTPDLNAVWKAAATHHGDRVFIDNVYTIYCDLLVGAPTWVPRTFSSLVALQITELRRYVADTGIRGYSTCSRVDVVRDSDGVVEASASRPAGANALWAFEVRIPLAIERVTIVGDDSVSGSLDLTVPLSRL